MRFFYLLLLLLIVSCKPATKKLTAQQIVDNLPNVGHVITNFTHPAHGYYYTLRDNPYVDVANDIHSAMVPSLANEQIIIDVINVFKNASKKVILYVNAGGPSHLQGNSAEELAILAAWEAYCNTNFGGDQGLGWRTLAKGYFERFKAFEDTCAKFVDVDNDGDLDFFVGTEFGLTSHLYQNDGSGVFQNVAETLGINLTYRIRASLWFDYNNDEDSQTWRANEDFTMVKNLFKRIRYFIRGIS